MTDLIDLKYIGLSCDVYFAQNISDNEDAITGTVNFDLAVWTDKLNSCKKIINNSKINTKIIHQYRDLFMEIVNDKNNYVKKDFIDTILHKQTIISYFQNTQMKSDQFPVLSNYDNTSQIEDIAFILNNIEIHFTKDKLNDKYFIYLHFIVTNTSSSNLNSVIKTLELSSYI